MKIVLRAFENKLSGTMEVPEETGLKFRLAMAQPIQVFNAGNQRTYPLMSSPIQTICEFEWTGSTFFQKGHEWDGAREYQLVNIQQ